MDLANDIVTIAGACAWLFTLLGFANRWGGKRWTWLAELACHFRRQYAWALALCGAWLAAGGRPLEAVLAAAGAGINAAMFADLHRPVSRRRSKQTIRLLSANVQVSNRDFDRFRGLVRRADPDLLILMEINEAWLPVLREQVRAYPHSKVLIYRLLGYGIGFLSRIPLEHAVISRIGKVMVPSIVARLKVGSRGLTVIGVHPFSPSTPRTTAMRNRQFQELAKFVAEQPKPLLIAGDFNTTSWSHAFQAFARATGLKDSRRGFGVQATWPAAVPLLRVPIDHCLVSEGVEVHRRAVGPDIRSDHLPILVDFSVS